MRMTKVPFESKYRVVLAEAKDFIRQLYEHRERQKALGLYVEPEPDTSDNDNKTPKVSFISEETERALKDAKQKLAEVL